MVPVGQLRQAAEQARYNHRDFAAALRSGHPAIISEIKKASPSKGVLVHNFDPVTLARQYEDGGASALSVLTDRDFFQGSLDDLRSARAACTLPVLRKDFTISEYHVLEQNELCDFRELASEYGLATLVEAHDAQEIERALHSGAEIIGINNRDLRTFQVSLDTSIQLAAQIPAGILKVSESGILDAADIGRLRAAGFDAFLVGEHLVKSSNPARALRELVA